MTLTAGPDIPSPTFARVAEFSSNGPRRLDSAQKPDVAAPGVRIPSAAMGTGTQAVRLSGTSMATPHTAGIAALVLQSHPTWSPMQVKSAIMSTASPSKVNGYDSARIGTGLVQPRLAAAAKAYAWTGSHLNSLLFGENQLSGSYTETQSFLITNKSSKAVTYDLRSTLSSPGYGADIMISPRTVTGAAGGTRTVGVRVHVSSSAVAGLPGASANDGRRAHLAARPRRGPTARAPQGHLPPPDRLALRPRAAVRHPSLRLGHRPVFGRPPADHPAQRRGARRNGRPLRVAAVRPRGRRPGSGDGRPDEPRGSVVAGTGGRAADVDRLLVFATSQASGTSTQASHEIDVLLDTNRDGTVDYISFAADMGLVTVGIANETVAAFTINVKSGAIVDTWPAPAPANGSTVLLPVAASRIGLDATSKPVDVQAAGGTVVTRPMLTSPAWLASVPTPRSSAKATEHPEARRPGVAGGHGGLGAAGTAVPPRLARRHRRRQGGAS